MSLSKVSQIDHCLYFLSHDEGSNGEIFDKDED